jgi:signal transduction histidine kinase/CheY-like chemotaxis protein/uncharacterized protein YdeI (BOF family)
MPHLLRIQGRVNYYDPEYKLLWFERSGHPGVYVQLGPDPLPIRTGQYVAIDGRVTPDMGLRPEEVTVKVISDDAPVAPLETSGHINDLDRFTNQVATAEGYVDSQLALDDHHVRLVTIVENRPVICWVFAEDPAKMPDWQGRLVRVTGLYSGRFDSTHTTSTIEFWLGSSKDVQVLGTLDSLAGFNESPTPIADLYKCGPAREVRVRGMIEARKAGTTIVVSDTTGEVEVRSLQQQRLEPGTEVDVVGHVAASNEHWVLEPALYRPVGAPAAGAQAPPPPSGGVLESAAQVRALAPAEAAGRRPVVIRGMVAWEVADADYFVLLDRTAGIRVYFNRPASTELQREKFIEVRGVTRTDRNGAAVILSGFTDLGSTYYPTPKAITVNEALTGRETGGWVEMRGFIRNIETAGDWRTVNVTTPDGSFAARFKLPFTFSAAPGARIHADGVCEVVLDPVSLETTVTVLIPGPQYLAVEEDAPGDLFNLPLRRISELGRTGGTSELLRVRVSGTVRYVVPGQSVYLEEGNRSLLILSRESQGLSAGERIEAAGVLGQEGARTVLRDAVFRHVGGGPESPAIVMADPRQLAPEADFRLVRMRGTLIDLSRGPGKTRLTLEQGDTLFDAVLDQSAGGAPLDPVVGAGLEVTGIYQLIFDDFRRPRAFQILLRSPADVRVITPARFWTARRSLMAASLLGGCVLLGLVWIATLRRRVRIQTEEIRIHAEERVRLEAEVQRAARLESLGRLAGGIAHEYNNLLTAITGNLSLIKLNPVVMAEERDQVLEIEKAARRARDVSRRLLTFSVGGEPVLSVTDLAGIVQDAAERGVRGTQGRCSYAIVPDLKPAAADPEQVAQAVEIMVRTAAHAMPEGGTIRISLNNVEIASASHVLPAGSYVKASIADSGEEISAEELQRIFDPFSSTRRDNSGLDLSTTYSIIKKHHGHIEAKSEAGLGVVFTFWLPVAKEGRESAPAVAAAVPNAGLAPPRRVLLMDDEESIRRISSKVLNRLGLEAVAVADGSSALKEFSAARETGNPFSLLVFDLTVPGGLGGIATIEAIRKTDARTPAIVCSGYASDPVMANFALYGFQAAVAKPYDIDRFGETVKSVLAGG